MPVGENIRRIRLQRRITQKELGLQVGISDSMVRKYELGIVNPRPKRLEELAAALDVNAEALKSTDVDTETAMQHLFQLFCKYGGSFDESENLYFQELNIKPLYERWLSYQADMKAALQISDESESTSAVQKVEEEFKYWMDTYR